MALPGMPPLPPPLPHEVRSYILMYVNQGNGFTVVGPFKTEADAEYWATRYQETAGDSWQVVRLNEKAIRLRTVLVPEKVSFDFSLALEW